MPSFSMPAFIISHIWLVVTELRLAVRMEIFLPAGAGRGGLGGVAAFRGRGLGRGRGGGGRLGGTAACRQGERQDACQENCQ